MFHSVFHYCFSVVDSCAAQGGVVFIWVCSYHHSECGASKLFIDMGECLEVGLVSLRKEPDPNGQLLAEAKKRERCPRLHARYCPFVYGCRW